MARRSFPRVLPRLLAVVAAVGCGSLPGRAVSPPAPMVETLYTGGTILTMAGATPQTVETLAVGGGRILHAGPLATAPRTASTRVVNLQGRTLLPGFIDTHGHFIYFGKNLLDADLVASRAVPCPAIPAWPSSMWSRPTGR